MNRSLVLLTSLLLLAGCQSLSTPTTQEAPTPASDAAAPSSARPQHKGSFKSDTLYSLLVAELAGQRDRFDLALKSYVAEARSTRDPAICERAYRIAEYVGADDAALETAQLWASVAPDNLDAQRMAAIQLARAGHHDEAMVYMERVLREQGDTSFDFLALTAAQLDAEARAGLLASFERLLAQHPENAQLVLGRALLLLQDKRLDDALQSLERNPAGSTEVAPILLRAQLLSKLQREDEVLPLLERGVRLHPDDRRLRLTYARQLVELRRFDEAIAQFNDLLRRSPEDDDLRLSLALVCGEAHAWTEARQHLQTLLQREAHVDAAHLNLGRIAEQQGDSTTAISEYRAVGAGNSYLSAQIRLTDLLIAGKRSEEALSHLQQARTEQPDYALQLYMLEIEKLAALQRLDEAWQRSNEALALYPGDLNLHYSRAMLAEKRGDLGALESNLRLILDREPDNSMALNALGYTLADRTTRYDEARVLIERAYSLNDGDPAILDSLGWVSYRQGRMEEAEQLLRRSLELMNDAEIAAHLGEVLWINGKRDEAHEIWNKAWKESPDNRILLDTLKRMTGKDTP